MRNVVLVVEDEPFARLLGVDLLEQAGFACFAGVQRGRSVVVA